MPLRFTCPQGHQWEWPSGEPPPSGGANLVCPLCSSIFPTPPPQESLPVGSPTGVYVPSEQRRPVPAAGEVEPPVIPDYEVLEWLGGGGMGQVFKARHRRLGRVVALKVIPREHLTHPEAVRRFRREVRAAAGLSHPNVVKVHGTGPAGGIHYLDMEYVAGADLARLVQRQGPLPVGRACDYVRQAALGLQHAHDNGLVHRDVKPANLLLADGGVVKVVDFGLARVTGSGPLDPSSKDLTRSGALLGTADFMAPEQALDPSRADARADIYGLGCTLYFLLTGRPPFPEGTLTQKLLWHQQTEPRPVEDLRPDVPPGVAAVVRRLMAKRPGERYPAPAQVAEALAPFCQLSTGATPVLPPADSRPRSATPPTGAKRLGWWLTVSAGGALLFALAARSLPSLFRPSPLRNESAPITALAALAAQVDDPNVDRDELRQKLLALRATAPGPREAVQAAALLARLPSPLDHLKSDQIAATERFDWQPEELVAVLGEHARRHWGEVRRVAFSPDERLLASAGDDGLVCVWDAETGQRRAVFRGHGPWARALAFAPRGGLLASGGNDTTIRLWDVANGQPVAVWKNGANVAALAYSPDGATLAAGGGDGVVRLWDPASRQVRTRCIGHTDDVWAVAFATDGRTLATGGEEGSLRLWDAATGREQGVLDPGPGAGKVTSVAFAPGGKTLAAGYFHGRVAILWDVDRKEPIRRLPVGRPTGYVLSVALSRDGKTLAAGSDGHIDLWDLDTGAQRPAVAVHHDDVLSVALSADGRLVASGCKDGAVKLWDLAAGRERGPWRGHRTAVRSVAFGPDGRTLATGSTDRTVRLWDAAELRELHVLPGHADAVFAVALAPDGRTLASGGIDSVVRLWDAERGRALKELVGHKHHILALAFAPDGARLASGSLDATVRLWGMPAGTERAVLGPHTGAVRAVQFSPDGRLLAAGDGDWDKVGEVKLWRWAERELDGVLPGKHRHYVTGLAFAPDGLALVSGGFLSELWRRNLAARQPPDVWPGHSGNVVAAFTPDGRTLISADTAGLIVCRDARSGKEYRRWQLPGEVHGLALTPDSRYLATANANGTVYLFRLPPPAHE